MLITPKKHFSVLSMKSKREALSQAELSRDLQVEMVVSKDGEQMGFNYNNSTNHPSF